MVGLDDFDTLCVDVENGTTGGSGAVGTFDAFGGDVGDGFGSGAVAVSAELGVFEEGAGSDEVFELLMRDVVVRLASYLAGTRIARCIYGFGCGRSRKEEESAVIRLD